MLLERYRAMIPEWDRFVEVARTPEPVTFRVRSGRIQPERIVGRLRARGFQIEPHPEAPGFFRLAGDPGCPLSRTLEHWGGLFYIQQAVMGLPVLALGARPGERVLDLCAAPGGKSSHLAERMEDRGCVVAADVREKRARILQANVKRLAHTSVLVLAADGTTFPEGAVFDRVLVDAPCSGEGNLRARGRRRSVPSASFRQSAASLQERLLRRAVGLVRPGGVVVYSTCTFAPEENEAVVDAVLRDSPVTVEPIELDVPHAEGLPGFGGRRYTPALEEAWRVYPHHLDSGGLFMVRLRRAGSDGKAEGWTTVPPAFEGDPGEPKDALPDGTAEEIQRFFDEFGADPAAAAGIRWLLRGESLWGHGCDRWPVESWDPEGAWRFLTLGLRAFERESRGRLRPSNDLLSLLGTSIGDRTVRLDRAGALRLLRGESVSVPDGLHGYVVLELDGVVVGRGIVRRARLEHQIPKTRARRLAEVLETGL